MRDISGSGQTRAAHKLCKSIPAEQKDHYEVSGAGHYGIFSGRRWREKVYPRIQAFIRAHENTSATKRPRTSKAAAKST